MDYKDKRIVTIANKRYNTAAEVIKGGCQGCIRINKGCNKEYTDYCVKEHRILIPWENQK